jgi:hypothetical protein
MCIHGINSSAFTLLRHADSIKSILCNYLENSNKSMLDITDAFNLSLQLLFETIFDLTNTLQVMHEHRNTCMSLCEVSVIAAQF